MVWNACRSTSAGDNGAANRRAKALGRLSEQQYSRIMHVRGDEVRFNECVGCKRQETIMLSRRHGWLGQILGKGLRLELGWIATGVSPRVESKLDIGQVRTRQCSKYSATGSFSAFAAPPAALCLSSGL